MRRRTFLGPSGRRGPLRRATKTGNDVGEDYYDKLGVTKIINAAGTYTALTASIMAPPVQAAVARAAKHPVRLRRTPDGGRRVHRQEAQVRGGDGDRRRGLRADPRDRGVHHRRQ